VTSPHLFASKCSSRRLQNCPAICCARYGAHFTPHTSLLTPHTSHLTFLTSHLIRHTSKQYSQPRLISESQPLSAQEISLVEVPLPPSLPPPPPPPTHTHTPCAPALHRVCSARYESFLLAERRGILMPAAFSINSEPTFTTHAITLESVRATQLRGALHSACPVSPQQCVRARHKRRSSACLRRCCFAEALASASSRGGRVCSMKRVGISFGTPDKEHITRIAVHDSLVQVQYSGTVCIHTHRAAAWGP
jgi:hypothetical protein